MSKETYNTAINITLIATIVFGVLVIIQGLAQAQSTVTIGGNSSASAAPAASTGTPQQVLNEAPTDLPSGTNNTRATIPFTVPVTGLYTAEFSIGTTGNNVGFDIDLSETFNPGDGNVFNTDPTPERLSQNGESRVYDLGTLTAGITYHYRPFVGSNSFANDVAITINSVAGVVSGSPEAVSNMFVGTFVEALTTCPANTQEVDGTVLTGGATDYPIVAAKNAAWVTGDDLTLPDWRGLFIRNEGGTHGFADASGVIQSQGTAANGLAVTYLQPNAPLADGVGGNGNGVRFRSTATATVSSTDDETRPVNVALKKCVILEL